MFILEKLFEQWLQLIYIFFAVFPRHRIIQTSSLDLCCLLLKFFSTELALDLQ